MKVWEALEQLRSEHDDSVIITDEECINVYNATSRYFAHPVFDWLRDKDVARINTNTRVIYYKV